MENLRIRIVGIIAAFGAVSVATGALAATVVKVNKGREEVILKLTKGELARLSKGDEFTFEAGGDAVEAEVIGISGNKAKVKVVFGIDSVSQGDSVTIKTGKKSPPVADEDGADSDATSPRAGNMQPFTFGTGGNISPFAGVLHAPWVMPSADTTPLLSPQRVYGILNPAQMVRVAKTAVFAGIQAEDAKLTSKREGQKTTTDLSGQDVGFTGILNIHKGFHIGLTYGQERYEFKFKAKIDGADDDYSGKSKLERDRISILISAPVGDRLSLGADYSQITQRSKPDEGEKNTTSYSILRPGVVYFTKQYEVGLKYSPPINIDEDGDSAADPRRLLLHAQMRLDGIRSVGGAVEHVHAAGLDDDSVDFANIRLSYDARGLPWGGWGFGLLHKTKSYRHKESAGQLGFPATGLQFLGDIIAGKATNVGLGLTYSTSEGKAKVSSDDEETKFTAQWLSFGVTLQHVM